MQQECIDEEKNAPEGGFRASLKELKMGWENKSGQKYVKLEAQQKGHCAKTTRPFVVHLSGILTSSLSGSEFPDTQRQTAL